MIAWLVATTACGRTTSLAYKIEGQKQRIEQPAQRAAPTETQRVVLDMSERCKAPDDRLRARCHRIAEDLREAISQTGREVILSNESHEAALLLAKERGAEIVLSIDLSAQAFSPSKHKPIARLQTPRTERVDRADLLCQPELRTALYHQNTHVRAPLQAEVKDARSRAVLFSYEDAIEADLEIPEKTLTAAVSAGRSQSANDDDDDNVAISVGHHHDHHCHHHDSRTKSDDQGAALFAAVVLTVLVVGIVVLAASAAQRGENRCVLSDIPEPTYHAKWQLSEELDRLLTTRLAHALFDKQQSPKE